MLIKNPLYYLPLERVQSFRKDGINISILQALKGAVNKKPSIKRVFLERMILFSSGYFFKSENSRHGNIILFTDLRNA
jgi:hypothetical protein